VHPLREDSDYDYADESCNITKTIHFFIRELYDCTYCINIELRNVMMTFKGYLRSSTIAPIDRTYFSL